MFKKQTGTRHKDDCKRVFARKDPTCPRCQELLKGAAPRPGYGYSMNLATGKYESPAQQGSRRSQEIRNHDCKKSGCGPICTAFDW